MRSSAIQNSLNQEISRYSSSEQRNGSIAKYTAREFVYSSATFLEYIYWLLSEVSFTIARIPLCSIDLILYSNLIYIFIYFLNLYLHLHLQYLSSIMMSARRQPSVKETRIFFEQLGQTTDVKLRRSNVPSPPYRTRPVSVAAVSSYEIQINSVFYVLLPHLQPCLHLLLHPQD
uniref:RRM domain-containing protein n=1 Tax=Heterorhabditis bacteriophora TaxID=37862 RepID=A0A1I7WQ23_HETBA